LTRNIEVLEERHKLHSVLLEQARLNEVLEEHHITSINVVQPASLEERPVSPDKKLCAATGLFAAIVLSLGLPVLLDWRLLMPTDSGQIVASPQLSDFTEGVIQNSMTSPKANSPSPVLDSDAGARIGAEPLLQATARSR
jgi:hypothetical protein